MIFDIYYKTLLDRRAPSTVFLESDYEHVGNIHARDRKELTTKLRSMKEDESPLERTRPLESGDVIIDEMNQGWILTPSSLWAQVEIVPES
jgi:hypothetical protein